MYFIVKQLTLIIAASNLTIKVLLLHSKDPRTPPPNMGGGQTKYSISQIGGKK